MAHQPKNTPIQTYMDIMKNKVTVLMAGVGTKILKLEKVFGGGLNQKNTNILHG